MIDRDGANATHQSSTELILVPNNHIRVPGMEGDGISAGFSTPSGFDLGSQSQILIETPVMVNHVLPHLAPKLPEIK
jgi:hypothetical protein